jgi:hypothetical protein
VVLEGRVPSGEVILPVPHFGRIVSGSWEDASAALQTRGLNHVLVTSGACDVSYRVALGEVPAFGSDLLEPRPPGALLAPSVPDAELPGEVHDVVQQLAAGSAEPLARAVALREFIRQRYRYDPAYLEDPGVARWLRSVVRGRVNQHIAALHAGRDSRHLGRGVCYELNTLACELLRRAGIPAAIATGWTLDRGQLAEPDHLWALALLPSDRGFRWYPIDASSTQDGRPLHAAERPAGSWRVRDRGTAPPSPTEPPAPPRSWRRAAPGEAPPELAADLIRLLRQLEAAAGRRPSSEAALAKRSRELLDDPERLLELLEHRPGGYER